MTSRSFTRGEKIIAAMKFVPPLIGNSLLRDTSFRKEYDFRMEAEFNFEASGVVFKAPILFKAIRKFFAGHDEVEITDDKGNGWKIKSESTENGVPNIVLISDVEQLTLPHITVLSEDAGMRLQSLEEAVSDVNLPPNSKKRWHEILNQRALENDEYDTFLCDLRDTPVDFEMSIRKDILKGKSTVSTLVPNSRRYFERLVGSYDGSSTVSEYACGAGRIMFEQLANWQPYKGFLFSLLLSSHSKLTRQIPTESLDKELVQAFDFIVKSADILTCLGALEVGLRIQSDRPEVEQYLLPLIQRIRDDDLEGETSEYKLFSSLFVLVDGELSRLRIMADAPPFYRRLAAQAQAALIHRIVVQHDINRRVLNEYALYTRGKQFYMQSLVDMRVEPKWEPAFVSPHNIKADHIGRILSEGDFFKENISSDELRDIIHGNGQQSLTKLNMFPQQFYPGPLEGTEGDLTSLPEELARSIESDLSNNKIYATSFVALVNSVLLFNVTSEHAELAAKALRLSNHTLLNYEDKSQLWGIVNGLAVIAAVTRTPSLADDIKILMRRYRRGTEISFTIGDEMRICLIASAAREDLAEWGEFVGEWLTEIAFSELKDIDGEVFHSDLMVLLDLAPELWISCSRADAALQAWKFR